MMRFRRILLPVLVIAALAVVACSKDGQVNADLDAVAAFSHELVNRVKSAPSPEAGVDAARSYFDAQRADIAERMTRVKAVRGFQINEETKKHVGETMVGAAGDVNGLKISLMMQTISNKDLDAKLGKLIDDFNALLTGD